MRLDPGTRLVIASHNEGKVREIADLLEPFGLSAVSAASLGLEEPEETGLTFTENAELKARAATLASGLPALADDSGLVVDALGGAPGIYSARWAGETKDFAVAMRRIEAELEAKGRLRPAATAHFICVLSLCLPGGRIASFEGRTDGHLTFPPRGTRGFGYDPIFVPEGQSTTFGEMDPAAKLAMNHRARAFHALVRHVFAPA